MSTARRGFAVRLLAACINLSFGMVVALLLSSTTGRWFAGRAALMLSIGSHDSLWVGPLPMILGILGNFVYGLPFALMLVLISEVLFAAGPGKWALKVSVTARDGSSAPVWRRLWRWAVKCGGLWGMVLALVLGSGFVAVVASGVGVLMLAGFFLATGSRRLALHDRLAGTAELTVRKPWAFIRTRQGWPLFRQPLPA